MSTFNELFNKIIAYKENHEEEWHLGDIDFNDYFTESTVGNFGKLKICVYTNEGTIPHFHLISKDKKFETCICIDRAEYFHHSFKTGVLNGKQKEALQKELLKEVYLDDDFKCSLWKHIKIIWNSDTDNKFKSKAKKMPDYNCLE